MAESLPVERTGGGEHLMVKSDDVVELKPRISLFAACAIIVGSVVGSGIYVSPIGILAKTGSPILAIGIWLICGIYTTLGALCYAELGTMIPKNGSDYIYVYEAWGNLPAFIVLWVSLIIINPTIIASISLILGEYACAPFFPESMIPSAPVKLVGASFTLLLTFVNCWKVQITARLQNVAVIMKVLTFAVICVAAIVYLCMGNTQTMTWEAYSANTNFSYNGIALAFYAGVYSYCGWNLLNYVTEELKDPHKNLPRAIYISLPIITLIYVLVNLAFFSVLSPPEMLREGSVVAASFAKKAMKPVAFLIPIFVVIACLGSLNGAIFGLSRMFFAGARNGHFPELIGMINVDNCTPVVSVVILIWAAMIMMMFIKVNTLMNYLAFSQTIIIIIAVAGLIKMRLWNKFLRLCRFKVDEEVERPTPLQFFIGIPIIFFFASLYLIVVPFTEDKAREELLVPAVIIFSGIPVYFVFVCWKSKPKWLIDPWIQFTHGIQLIVLSVPDESTKSQ